MNLIGYNCFGFCKYIAFIIVIHFFLSGLLSCIGFLGCSHPISIDKSGAIPSLREEPNPQRRTGAAMILGGSKDPRAVQALIDSLRHDPSGPVRMAAASSLGEIKDSRSVGPLIGALKDPDNVVRAATASSLGR